MTTEQLQTARLAHWHQNANPILTLDDATVWLDQTGLCLFLPRPTQLPVPAPSFVEACLGEANATPARPAIETASELATRLVSNRALVPLNLLGLVSEQPDFLVTPEILPYLLSLRGDRDWKSAPAGRTSPLVIEIWKLLDKKGALETQEIREELGREVTEAAVLRGLVELWTEFRIVPTYEAGQPTLWKLFKADYAKQLATGANTAQATALSVLISLYLQSSLGATSEEIETFLSPLASRSRIREVIHGLTATRQLATTAFGTKTLIYIEGILPVFAEPEPAPVQETQQESITPAERPHREDRPSFRREDRPARKSFGERFTQREGERNRPQRFAADGERRPSRPGTGRPSYGKPRSSFDRGDRSTQGREERGGDFKRRPAGDFPKRKPFGQRTEQSGRPSFRKPFGKPGESKDRKPYGKREDRPFRPREDRAEGGEFKRRPAGKPYGQRSAQGDRPAFKKPFGKPGEGGDRKRFGARPGFSKGPGFGKSDDRRPFRPREDRQEGTGEFKRKPAGDFPKRKPYGERREQGSRPPFKKPFGKSAEGGERKRFGKGPGEDRRKQGDRPAFKKSFGDRKPFASRGPRKETEDTRPSYGENRGKSAGPRTGKSSPPRSGRPSFGGKPSSGRPSAGKGGRFSKPGGKPSFGKKPMGGSRPPFKKSKPRRKEDSE